MKGGRANVLSASNEVGSSLENSSLAFHTMTSANEGLFGPLWLITCCHWSLWTSSWLLFVFTSDIKSAVCLLRTTFTFLKLKSIIFLNVLLLNNLYVFGGFVFNSAKPFKERKWNRKLLLVRNTGPSGPLKTPTCFYEWAERKIVL